MRTHDLKILFFIGLILLALAGSLTANATTASVSCSNSIVSVGQYESCNAVLSGYSGSSTFTYNFTVANSASISPQFMTYLPQYDAYPAGYSTVKSYATSNVLTEGELFVADFSPTTYALSLYSPTFTTAQDNAIITSFTNNGEYACITIGGSSQSSESVTGLLATTANEVAFTKNVVNAITTGTQLGILPLNCIEIDFEFGDTNYVSGANGIALTNLMSMLSSNILAINSNDLLNFYGAPYENYTASTGINWNALVPYVNYFDIAAYNGNGDLNNFVVNKGLDAKSIRASWDMEDSVDPADNVFSFAYYLANVPTYVTTYGGISQFDTPALSFGTNVIVMNAIKSNTVLDTYQTHNAIYTGVATTSNTFTFIITANDITTANSIQKVRVRVSDALGNTITSAYSPTFSISMSGLASNSFTASNAITDQDNYQVLTAVVSGGVTPYTYNYQVFNSVGLVANALYSGNSITSNSFTFQMNPSWGTGTFTANLVVKDSASGSVANTLTFTVNTAPTFPPTGILYYIPIVLKNNQGTALTANTPLSFTFNALAYQRYETNTLNNTELFFANGTIAVSWLEGNVNNEQQQANTLYTSNNILYWFKTPSGYSWIGANTGVAPTNTIYLGFAGNTPNSGNLLLSSVTGMAPQLTCSNPASTATCSKGNQVSGTYGQYDNGANVFKYYDNFTTLNGWTIGRNMIVNNGVNVNNGVIIDAIGIGSGFGFSYIISNTAITPNVLEIDINNVTHTGAGIDAGDSVQYGYSNNYMIAYFPLDNQVPAECDNSQGINLVTANVTGVVLSIKTAQCMTGFSVNSVSSFQWISTGNEIYQQNYTNVLVSTDASQAFGTTNIVISAVRGAGSPGTANFIFGLSWIRDRTPPPNAIMPSATFQPLLPIQTPTLTLSNTLIDQGQSILFTATTTTGNSPYTYNYQITNSITNVLVANMLFTNNAYTSNTWLWTPATNLYANSIRANVFITDAEPATVNSVFSNIGYNSMPTITVNTISNTLLDSGQYVRFTVTESGGTGATFNAELYNVTGSKQQGTNVLITALSGSNSIKIPVISPLNSNTFTYNWIVSDLGTTTPYTFNSISNSFTVNMVLGIPALTPSAPSLSLTQPEVLTALFTGGTGPFTYNYTISNSLGIVFNSLVSNSFRSNTFTFTPLADGTYQANIVITDSATASETANSVNTVITVASGEVSSLIISNTSIDAGQLATFQGIISGGTGPYTYNYQVINSVTGLLVANQLWSGVGNPTNVFVFNTLNSAGNTLKANVIIKDSIPTTTNSIYSAIITVNSALVASSVTPTTQTQSSGNPVTIYLSTVTTGTPTYSYDWLVYDSNNNIIYNTGSFTGTNSLMFSVPYTGTFYANVLIKDSATTQQTANSIPITIIGVSGGGGGGGGGGGATTTIPANEPSNTIITQQVPNPFNAPLATILAGLYAYKLDEYVPGWILVMAGLLLIGIYGIKKKGAYGRIALILAIVVFFGYILSTAI